MTTESKRVKLDRLAKQYILDAIDGEPYEQTFYDNDYHGKLEFLKSTFKAEYGHMIERVGACNAMKEWIMGLPSAFNIDFENYKILQIAVKWDSLPSDYTEKQAQKILDNWFNLIAVKTFQLFRKYKIEV